MGEEPANVYWPWPCSSGDCWSGRERDLGLANPSMLSIVDKNMVYQSREHYKSVQMAKLCFNGKTRLSTTTKRHWST